MFDSKDSFQKMSMVVIQLTLRSSLMLLRKTFFKIQILGSLEDKYNHSPLARMRHVATLVIILSLAKIANG